MDSILKYLTLKLKIGVKQNLGLRWLSQKINETPGFQSYSTGGHLSHDKLNENMKFVWANGVINVELDRASIFLVPRDNPSQHFIVVGFVGLETWLDRTNPILG
jgi:hypothetical protein